MGYLSPRHRVCTKGMFILKGSDEYREPKNVIAGSVQKTFSQLRTSKLPVCVYRRIWSIMEIWENYGLPNSKVPRLYHGNVYMKRKLRYGEPKNVIAVSVQKTLSQLRASKLPEFVYRRVWSIMEIWGKLAATYLQGTAFSPRQCLHEMEATGMASLKM